MPTPFEVRKAAFGNDRYWRGRAGIGGVSSPGHAFTAVGQEPRTTLHLCSYREDSLRKVEGTRSRGEP